MRNILRVLCYLLITSNSFAQPTLEWTKSPVSEAGDYVNNFDGINFWTGGIVQVDDSGNIYYLINKLTGGKLVKTSPDGNHLWTKTWMGVFPKSFTINNGAIQLAGGFQGTVLFDSSIPQVTSKNGLMRAYYQKLDLNGNHQSLLTFQNNNGAFSSLSTDQSGYIYVSGGQSLNKISAVDNSIVWSKGSSQRTKVVVSPNGAWLYIMGYGSLGSIHRLDPNTGNSFGFINSASQCGYNPANTDLRNILVDNDGNLIISGAGFCSVLANQSGLYHISPFELSNFVVKIDPNGIVSPKPTGSIFWKLLDSEVLLAIDANSGSLITFTSDSFVDNKLSYYSGDGELLYTISVPFYSDLTTGILSPNGNIYLLSEFGGTGDFNPLPEVTCNKTFSTNQIIIQKFAPSPHPPVVITSPSSGVLCQGGSITLQTNSSPENRYQWKRNGLVISTENNATLVAMNSGEYVVRVTNTNTCESNTGAIAVTTENNPEVTINNNTISLSVCDESSLTLTANATGSNLQYTWKKDDITIPEETNSFYTFNASQGTYSVVVSTPTNCTTSREINVQTINNYDPSISASSIGGNPIREVSENNYMFCEGSQVSLESDRSYQYYQWKRDGVDISGATSRTLTANTPGEYTVFTTTNTGCTKLSHELTLGMSPSPSLSLNYIGAVTKCVNESIQFETQNLPGYTYRWLKDGNTASTGDPGPQHILTYSTLFSSRAGVYSVRLTDETGCQTLSPEVTLAINSSVPQAIIENQIGNVCSLNGIELQANTGTDLSYQWKLNGTDIPNATAYNHFAKNSGNYTVQVSKSGCSRISSERSVNISTPLLVSIQGPESMCYGSQVNLAASVTTIDGQPVNLSSYTTYWSAGTPTADPTVRQISSSANYTFRVTSPEYGCQYSATKTVVNYGTTKPVVQRSGDICLTNSVTLTASEAGGYLWSTGETTRSITGLPSRTYTVRTINANGGCQSGTTNFYVEACSMSSQFSYYAEEEETEFSALTNVFPNPADQELTITLPKAVEQRSRLLLIDQLGKVVSEIIFEKREQKKHVSTTTFTSGIYLLKLESNEGTLMKKIMISHRQ